MAIWKELLKYVVAPAAAGVAVYFIRKKILKMLVEDGVIKEGEGLADAIRNANENADADRAVDARSNVTPLRNRAGK